jgi:hypothetical protein
MDFQSILSSSFRPGVGDGDPGHEERVREHEKSGGREYRHLASKYNEILDGLKNQNKKILDIYSSEKTWNYG